MKIDIEELKSDSPNTFAHCQHIRRAVFCKEQGVAETIEWDGLDATCQHYLARVKGTPVGTARTRPYHDNHVKIERVAVLKEYRSQGIGHALMEHILVTAERSGAAGAALNAQIAVKEFYLDLGFVPEGPEFIEADIPHIHMRRYFSSPQG